MQHDRIPSRDEWLPARRRRLNREREITRRRGQFNPERRRNGPGADFDLTDWTRRPDDYHKDPKGRASAA